MLAIRFGQKPRDDLGRRAQTRPIALPLIAPPESCASSRLSSVRAPALPAPIGPHPAAERSSTSSPATPSVQFSRRIPITCRCSGRSSNEQRRCVAAAKADHHLMLFQDLRTLQAACTGDRRAFDRILDEAYGRTGRLKWEIMKVRLQPVVSRPARSDLKHPRSHYLRTRMLLCHPELYPRLRNPVPPFTRRS